MVSITNNTKIEETPVDFKAWTTQGNNTAKLHLKISDGKRYIFNDEDIKIILEQLQWVSK